MPYPLAVIFLLVLGLKLNSWLNTRRKLNSDSVALFGSWVG